LGRFRNRVAQAGTDGFAAPGLTVKAIAGCGDGAGCGRGYGEVEDEHCSNPGARPDPNGAVIPFRQLPRDPQSQAAFAVLCFCHIDVHADHANGFSTHIRELPPRADPPNCAVGVDDTKFAVVVMPIFGRVGESVFERC
jgi:hypothetical protein